MADKLSGVEASAVSLLTRAVEMDQNGRFTESLVCYQEGIQLLLEVLKGSLDDKKKTRYRERISDYMGRAEVLKTHVEKEKQEGKYHEQIQIVDGSTGHSYEKVLGRFLDSALSSVEVDDPYIRSAHQVYNFLRFCELLVKSAGNVRHILLNTGLDDDVNAQHAQKSRLNELKTSLEKYNCVLDVKYHPALHDREIRLSNGWIIKIGRGLDYFKATPKFSVGFCDMDLRQTHKTTVDIFHTKHTKPAEQGNR